MEEGGWRIELGQYWKIAGQFVLEQHWTMVILYRMRWLSQGAHAKGFAENLLSVFVVAWPGDPGSKKLGRNPPKSLDFKSYFTDRRSMVMRKPSRFA